MPLSNTSNRYGWLSKTFHWLSALLVIGLFLLGQWMIDLDYYHKWYRDSTMLHMSFGIVLCLMTVARLIWLKISPKPTSVNTGFSKRLEKIGHWSLYAFLFGLFISGYLIFTADGRGIHFFNWIELPALITGLPDQEDNAGEIHEIISYLLIGSASIHALISIWHHFWLKDNTLKRMLNL